jgi:uncharacterized peroxidase-related enzyme
MRIEYHKVAPKALEAMAATARYVANGSISPKLRALVELRVSQINGCAFCVDKHNQEARHAGETQQRLDTLVTWHETSFFTEQERAALEWAEALTHISTTHAADEIYDRIRPHFTDLELTDLTVIISMMNAWNRLAISLRKEPNARP